MYHDVIRGLLTHHIEGSTYHGVTRDNLEHDNTPPPGTSAEEEARSNGSAEKGKKERAASKGSKIIGATLPA